MSTLKHEKSFRSIKVPLVHCLGIYGSVEGELPRISRESGRGARSPRHGECEMRGSESLTINAIDVNGGNFGGHLSCIYIN